MDYALNAIKVVINVQALQILIVFTADKPHLRVSLSIIKGGYGTCEPTCSLGTIASV